jgi:cyclophilin family peptidyl-prolyl cis-trans isomerase
MKNTFAFICLIVFAFSACKKEEVTPTNPKPQPTPTDTIPKDTVVKENIIEVETEYGNIYIWLYKSTPLHRANFIKLADSGFFNQTTFHRIIPGFMIQGGDPNSKDSDPTNDGQGGPGYTIPAEINDSLKNDRGTLAAARLGNSVNPTKASSGSQFYINVVNNVHLNKEYTVFGKVIKGIEVTDSIVIQPRNTTNNRPLTDIRMQVRSLKLTEAEILERYQFVVPK